MKILKVSATSKTANVAKAIYAVLILEKQVQLVGIGESAVAKTTKAVASARQMVPGLTIDIQWSQHDTADKGVVSGITFELTGHPDVAEKG